MASSFDILSAFWGGACCASAAKDEELSELVTVRQGMKRFIQALVRGKAVEMVVGDGGAVTGRLTLSSDLDYLRLAVPQEAEATIRVTDILQITPGTQVTGATIPLDDLCTTIVLKNRDCLTFRFEDLEEREQFTENMKILRLSLTT